MTHVILSGGKDGSVIYGVDDERGKLTVWQGDGCRSSHSSHHFTPLDFWKSPKHACIHVRTCKSTTITHDNMPQKLCMLSVLMGFRQKEGCPAFRFLLIFFLFTSSWATELTGLSYKEKVFIKEKEKKRREEQLLCLGRRTASGAQ